jgi:hypothetical protein
MKILVCGDRNWTNIEVIEKYLIDPEISSILCGGAPGADTIAESIASTLGKPVKVFMADWSAYGKAAGPIRNIKMLDENPDKVLVFHNNFYYSKGSKHCAAEAIRRNIPVYLISEYEKEPRKLN